MVRIGSVSWIQDKLIGDAQGALEAFAKGELSKPVVIECSATWCGPCRQVMPHLDQIAQQYQDKVVFAGIFSDDRPKVEALLKRSGKLQYSIGCDTDQWTQDLMMENNIRGIPAAFVFAPSAEGKPELVFAGHPADGKFVQALDQACSRKVGPPKWKSYTKDEMLGFSVKELKEIFRTAQLPWPLGGVEKYELVEQILKAQQ